MADTDPKDRVVELFNTTSPTKIRAVVKGATPPCGIDVDDATAWGRFIFEYRGALQKAAIGNYFCSLDPLAGPSFAVFLSLAYQLGGVPIDSALRLLLADLQLPSEAQQIDRLLEGFAAAYSAANPELTRDACVMLLFASIMLSVDLHQAPGSSRPRMTETNFVNSMKGMDIAESLMKDIYYRISRLPLNTSP
jgi:Sec7-like guanine-nucleotide exchange factor